MALVDEEVAASEEAKPDVVEESFRDRTSRHPEVDLGKVDELLGMQEVKDEEDPRLSELVDEALRS